MRTLKHCPVYQDWSGVPIETIPGRCYSIAELLARTVRGERLPGFSQERVFEDPRHPEKNDDETINAAIDEFERNPLSDRSLDIADAWAIKYDIESRMN